MADGAIRVETKLDTKGVEKGIEDINKMCESTKKHIENMAEKLNIKTNPIEIINNSELVKSKRKLEEINTQIAKIQAETDKILPQATTNEQVVNLLNMEEEKTKDLVAEQENLNKAISQYEAKQAQIVAEKQREAEIKSSNTDISGTVAGNDFVSKINSAEQYEAALDKVSTKMKIIEEEANRLAAEKGIDSSDVLKANKEYQKLKKQYDALISSSKEFKKSSKSGFDSAKSGAKSLGSSMKSAIKTMTKYTLAIFGARSAFYAIKNAISQVLSDNEELSNTVTAMKGAFANALTPVIERVVYWLKYAFAYVNLFVKVLTGVDMAAQYNAKALKKQSDATKEAAKSTKEANKQLAAFDEMNVAQKDTSSTTSDTSSDSSSTPSLLDLPDVSGGKFEQICENIKAHINELETLLGAALLATGFILLAVGQIPMGIACIIAGISLTAIAIGNWSELSSKTQAMITAIMAIAGAAFLAIGFILCATGVKLPLGIAMIAIGAAMIVTAISLKWGYISQKISSVISIISAIVGGALLVIGAILAFTSPAHIPLGIALMAAGAATLITAIAINWNELPDKVKITVGIITAIVSAALLVIGILLALTWTNLPLAMGLIAAGAVSLITSVAIMWNALPEKVKNIISIIMAIVSTASLVLGIILCATGVNLPLGIALIAAGAAGLITVVALNYNVVKEWVSSAWGSVKSFWNSSIAPVFTTNWWKNKFDVIRQGMKNALNGVISIVENAINRIIARLNSFHIKIPNWVPDYGGSSLGFNISYVNIPRLAKGGIVNNPGKGQAIIAGEAGAEAVLPLQNNTEWMDTLVDKVAEKVSMNVINRIYLDGKEINSSSRKYNSRFEFATNGGVL